MDRTSEAGRRCFHAHESVHAARLEGLPLASFWQRAVGYVVDLVVAILLWGPLEYSWRHYVLREEHVDLRFDFHEPGNILVLVVYLGLGNYLGNGQTAGKWVARTRAMSLTSERMKPWQSVERALGYGAAVLELGLGFAQFFWDRNRMCAQDRLAETIVVDTRRRSAASE